MTAFTCGSTNDKTTNESSVVPGLIKSMHHTRSVGVETKNTAASQAGPHFPNRNPVSPVTKTKHGNTESLKQGLTGMRHTAEFIGTEIRNAI